MQYDPIQGQGYEALKVGNPPIFKSYLIFCLVFVSRFFELGRNVSCEGRVDRQSVRLVVTYFIQNEVCS